MGADAHAGAAREREAEIEKAVCARVPDFRKQADSLTLEGVRRALEKDLDLEIYSLDAHKKFIKQCVDKVFAESDDENANDNASEDAKAKDDHLSKEGPDDAKPIPVSNKTSSSADVEVLRSSETEKDPKGEKDQASSNEISEDMIKEAIEKRASYFRKNSETLTLQGVRRTLEEDLKLQKKALDAYKTFITTELDKVLQEPANGTQKKSKKDSKETDQKTSKGSKRVREDSDSSEFSSGKSDMEDSDVDTRPRKKRAEKAKVIKKQKKVADVKKLSTPKAKKVAKRDSDRSAKEQGGNSGEEDNSRSSAEEDNKRIRQQALVYGKLEHLKSIIKSCGLTIPPTVYRKAKQAPENKREACLIKELEGILEKEGLSKNPSEKEIKAVKKRKEKAKELEGIDMSNIITSSRRRSTSSFIPLPPPPKIEADSDDEEDDDPEDDEDVENVEGGDEGDNDDAEAGNGSADESADAKKESD